MAYEAEEEVVKRRRSMEVKEQGAAADLISSIVAEERERGQRSEERRVGKECQP